MTDFLTVKALRTFAVGVGLKTKRSDDFDIEASEARLLEAQGLVEIVGEAKVAESEADAEVDAAAENETPAKQGRKAKANAVNEDA